MLFAAPLQNVYYYILGHGDEGTILQVEVIDKYFWNVYFSGIEMNGRFVSKQCIVDYGVCHHSPSCC